jgi:hypothetical protein
MHWFVHGVEEKLSRNLANVYHRPNRCEFQGANCFNNYHTNVGFGLAHKDMPLHGRTKNDWKEPLKVISSCNAAHIWKIAKELP